MYKLGICAPYKRCETTLAALRLADLGRELAMSVKLLAYGDAQSRVDYYWDTRVIRDKGNAVYQWARGCSHIVWFDGDEAKYSKAFLVSPAAKHWYIPMPHKLRESARIDAHQESKLICPSKQSKDSLPEMFSFRNSSWCLWDSGLDAVQSRRPESDDVRIYVPMSSHAIDETGILSLRAISDVLKLFKNSMFTVECSKSWAKAGRSLLRDIKNEFGDRFSLSYGLSPVNHIKNMHQHDWTWIPSTRVNTGIVAQRSLACGTPVIVYNVSPHSEFIVEEQNGLLIECDIYSNWAGAPVAGPRFISVVNALSKAVVGDRELVSRCQRSLTTREKKHTKQFRLFWAREWDVV